MYPCCLRAREYIYFFFFFNFSTWGEVIKKLSVALVMTDVLRDASARPSLPTLFLVLTLTVLVVHLVHAATTLYMVDHFGHLIRTYQLYEDYETGLDGPYRDGILTLAFATLAVAFLWTLVVFAFWNGRKQRPWSRLFQLTLGTTGVATVLALVTAGLNIYFMHHFQDIEDRAYHPPLPEELSDFALRGAYGHALLWMAGATVMAASVASGTFGFAWYQKTPPLFRPKTHPHEHVK